ncbi:putative phenylalanine--tRNA ligase beta subunit [Capsicum annuum]|nr:putative phenylalanine--tRNA ligase beta subunit [Capsicum annuum]
MPTVSVGRDRLFEALGRTYTDEEFDELCFKFGIELDDINMHFVIEILPKSSGGTRIFTKRFRIQALYPRSCELSKFDAPAYSCMRRCSYTCLELEYACTTEKAIQRKEKHLDEEGTEDDGETIYKIEVPANRYDLLCLEGLAQALRIFNGLDPIPTYNVANIGKESMLEMHVKTETSKIRPYVVCAVLRGVTFDEAKYNSFIDLQDRLHQNICRRRTLVAIGTHDLDTIEGPFTYEALPPAEINFVPLKQTRNFRADELMEFYKSDLKLKKFLHIIENSPVYPVIYDCKRTVLSLPPIINGAHSAISLKTKNVFIECTATDLTKANIVLNTMVTMFSVYCERKFEVEPVKVTYSDGKSFVYPDLSIYNMNVPLSYITGIIGVQLPEEKLLLLKFKHIHGTLNGFEISTILASFEKKEDGNFSVDTKQPTTFQVASLLHKMQLRAEKSLSEDKKVKFVVFVPPTRSDVLHPCDVAEVFALMHYCLELLSHHSCCVFVLIWIQPLNHFLKDVAIAYGYNEIPKRKPASLKPLPLSQFSDLIRTEIAMAGYTEVLTWILCTKKEISSMLNREEDSSAAIIADSRTSEFECLGGLRLPSLPIHILGASCLNASTFFEVLFRINTAITLQVVRSTLMPGLLRTVGHNKDHSKPIKIFEVGDVVFLDATNDVGAVNRRHLAALYCGATSGFELIHGLLDKIMEATGANFVSPGNSSGYYIEKSEEPALLQGRQASVIYAGKRIGTFGIVHPKFATANYRPNSGVIHVLPFGFRSSRSLTFRIPAPFWSLTCRLSYSQVSRRAHNSGVELAQGSEGRLGVKQSFGTKIDGPPLGCLRIGRDSENGPFLGQIDVLWLDSGVGHEARWSFGLKIDWSPPAG